MLHLSFRRPAQPCPSTPEMSAAPAYAITLADVQDAAACIGSDAHRTPVHTSQHMDTLAGKQLFFKAECLQRSESVAGSPVHSSAGHPPASGPISPDSASFIPIHRPAGSFKIRGALNAVRKSVLLLALQTSILSPPPPPPPPSPFSNSQGKRRQRDRHPQQRQPCPGHCPCCNLQRSVFFSPCRCLHLHLHPLTTPPLLIPPPYQRKKGADCDARQLASLQDRGGARIRRRHHLLPAAHGCPPGCGRAPHQRGSRRRHPHPLVQPPARHGRPGHRGP